MWIAISNAIGSRQPVGGGAPPDPGYTPPLDTYTGATAAYSVRKLSSSYSGSCIEAYRVSDGATQDIGFDSAGLIDTAAIATFSGGSDVRVSVWYDQSGNGVDITNTSATLYPLIYESGSITESNDNPALKCFNAEGLINTSGSFSFPISYFAVYTSNGTASGYVANLIGLDRPLSGAYTLINTSSGITVQTTHDGYKAGSYSGSISTGTMGLYRAIINGASSNLGVNGNGHTRTLAASGSGGAIGVNFVEYSGGSSNTADNHVTEVILFSDAKGTSDIEGIETNINAYYNVYTEYNPDAPTSGFLFDYSGASVAYSVRQLNNNATVAMRVRRTVAPFDEQDIGFDSNGDLDTSAISTFGGSDPLTLSRWYDQTGNQNHATQLTAGSQPQIYDGSTVTDVIGRPGVDFYNVIDRYMQFSAIATSGSDFTVSYVGALNGDSRNTIVGLRGGGTSNTRYIRTSFQKINVSGYQSAYGTIASGLNEYSIIVTNQSQAGTVYRNNASIVTGTTDSALYFDTIGGTDSGNAGVHSEIVIWESVLSTTDRTGVYNNQDTYYSIP